MPAVASRDAEPGDLAQRLHQRGLRMTPQRQQVLDAVRALEHATPEQISAAVPAIDLMRRVNAAYERAQGDRSR